MSLRWHPHFNREGTPATHSDCYEKGHTPPRWGNTGLCAKCRERLFLVSAFAADGPVDVWHTQAELDRLWHGVDREAARVLGEEGR